MFEMLQLDILIPVCQIDLLSRNPSGGGSAKVLKIDVNIQNSNLGLDLNMREDYTLQISTAVNISAKY